MPSILVAPNALKGSLSAPAAARAIGNGLRAVLPQAQIDCVPIADGGDGTAEVLALAGNGELIEEQVHDALGRVINARWASLADGTTAVVDVAAASGLARLMKAERNPLTASSYGTGQLLRCALEKGRRRLILGVGGSATVDAGSGLLQALGVRLVDARGKSLALGAAGLAELAHIDVSGMDERTRAAHWLVACDVRNALVGPEGAARIYAPQKGASPAEVERLEDNLVHFADVVQRELGVRIHDCEFGGAAGGIAAALKGVLGAELVSGIELVLQTVDFETHVSRADWVITAEGHFDAQTLRDKGPWGVARAAYASKKPVVLLCGGVSDDVRLSELPEVTAVIGICAHPMGLQDAVARAAELLERCAERVGKLLGLPFAPSPERL